MQLLPAHEMTEEEVAEFLEAFKPKPYRPTPFTGDPSDLVTLLAQNEAPGGGRHSQPANLRDELLGSVRVMDSAGEFGEKDFRWAETKMGEDRANQDDDLAEIYINHQMYQGAGAKGYEEKVVLGEALHNLKNIQPERYNRMEQDALADPKYRAWAQESYQRSVNLYGEDRPFEEWHRHSRFDQVIGGYLFAGDESMPTMRDWDREALPWGDRLRKHLESLARDLQMK